MERSDQINELAGALSKAQGVIIPASKDSDNPFFKSKYADLASVWEVAREPLSKNGLSIMQHPSAEANVVTVETVLTHSSGQWMSSRLTMNAKDASPQAIGSCITYARRYGLSAVVGIASEIDDDGNAATHAPIKGAYGGAPTKVQEPKDIPFQVNNPNEEVITKEQGEALLGMLKLHGYTKDDLKIMIGEKWGLNGLTEIKNGHLLAIKKHFSTPKKEGDAA